MTRERRPGQLGPLRGLRLLLAASWSAGRLLTVGSALLELVSQLTGVLALYGAKLVVDGSVAADRVALAAGAALIAGALVIGQIAQWWAGTLQVALREKTAMTLERRLIELAAGIPGTDHFERPEVADKMKQVWEARWGMGEAVSSALNMLQVGAQAGLSLWLLSRLDLRIVGLMMAGVVPAVAAWLREQLVNKADVLAAPDYRLGLQLRDVAKDHRAAAELRLHCLGPLLGQRHREAHRRFLDRMEPVHIRGDLWHVGGDVVFSVAKVVAMLVAARLAAGGRISIGDAVLAVGLVARTGQQVNDLCSGIDWFLWALRSVGRLAWLMGEADKADQSVKVSDPAAPPDTLTDGIRLESVSFSYPGTDNPVLSGVDLFFPAGSTVAVVGENGAGKTTIIKLLCRFYEPDAGRILVDGIPLSDIPPSVWRTRVSAAFQEPAPFDLVLREAVGVGDLTHLADDRRVISALDRAGAAPMVSSLPAGLDTRLGPTFDEGVEMSGGQWQQLALARALMRERPLLLVLDEPTAALDPGREHALFEGYAAAATTTARETGGITVLVSHRFSTVRMADLIVVVSNGRVTETGSHAELVATGGLYAELYGIQAAAYGN